MKKTLNRVLACFLAVALLVSCCISGLVLPAAASTVGQNLITNSDVKLELMGGSYQAPTFNFSQPLEVGKRYILRFKMHGGSGKIYHDASALIHLRNISTQLLLRLKLLLKVVGTRYSFSSLLKLK